MEDARFWAKVEKLPSGCWEWTGFRDRHGYGRLQRQRGVSWLAHRRAWFLTYGSLPEPPLVFDHLCRNTRCVNPVHLEPVTQRENSIRADFTSRKRLRTHCKRGHELTPENTVVTSTQRYCRTCKTDYARNWKRGQRADPERAARLHAYKRAYHNTHMATDPAYRENLKQSAKRWYRNKKARQAAA